MSDLTPLPPGIVLCVRCGARLSALKAIPEGAAPLCTDCADEQASTRRLRAVRSPEWVSIDESPPPLPNRLPWLTYVAAAAVVAIAGVAMTMRRAAPKEVPAIVVLAPEPAPPAPPPAEDAGQKALEEKREAEAVRLRELAGAQEDLASLDQETAGPETLEEYGRVFEMLEKARGRHDEDAWTRGIEERIALLRGKVDSHFAAVRQFDLESRDPGEKAKLRERVTHWGMPAYAAELEKSAATAPPPPPPPRSREAQAYLEEWERAMARAAARDYDRAFPDLRKAAKGLQEEATRREAATDLDDLQRVMMLHEEIGRIVSAWPRGSPIALERAAGALVAADADRVEVRVAGAKETVFVEISEASAGSLAALVKGRVDPRPLGLFCLIEGHAEAARPVLERPDEVPAKYWAWAAVARARLPAPDAEALRQERSARDHYYAAEREWRSPGTRGMAVERYRALAKDFLDTRLVRRASRRIAERSEGAREYYHAAGDMAGGGTFRKGKAGWATSSESDFSRGHENFVEVEFYAMPGESYRAWFYAGGCCAETFAGSFYQVSDLVVPHPMKSGQKAQAEPGSLFAVAIAPPAVPMKASHAAHGAGREPEAWGWIEVPLPKFPQAGAKRVRLVAVSKGFGVARAVVSSTRKSAPGDADVKELEASREPDLAPAAAPAPAETGLSLRLQEPGPDVPDAPNLRIEGDLTILVRLKVGAEPAEKSLIAGKGENYSLWLLPGNRILFQQSGVSGRPVLSISPPKALAAGRWVTVAAIVRGGHGTLYVDGIPEAARGRTGLPATSAAPLAFGACTIDEVRIYAKALSSDQIAEASRR